MAAVVANVWKAAEFRQGHLGIDSWVMFFRMADYPRPQLPLTLYRGTTKGRTRGMAWTTDPDKARWFAERFNGFVGDPAGLFRTAFAYIVVAPPDAALADIDSILPSGGRGEHEVVVDPRLLPRVQRLI
jgi:hypothetical protein